MSSPPEVTRSEQLLPEQPGRRGLGARAALATAGVLAVLAGAVAAGPAGAADVPDPEPAPSGSLVVRVDPVACAAPAGSVEPAEPAEPAEEVLVCTPAEATARVGDGTTVVLAAGTHAGPLDLRGHRDLLVRGEPGAVLDAGSGRYALSLRDVTQATVEELTLRGGSAQTVWVERTDGVTLRSVTVAGGAGAGLQLRDSAGFRLADSVVRDAAAAGAMELTGVTGSTYERLAVTGNGRGEAPYNGDGLQLAGTGVTVRDVVTTGNGSSELYEHGIYVAATARDVLLTGVTSTDNSGVAVKLGGSGVLTGSTLTDDRIALYGGTTAGSGWVVSETALSAPRPYAGDPSASVRIEEAATA